MKNDKDETITSRNGIANVFGEFYSNIYAEDQLREEVQDPHNSATRMSTERESRIDDVKNEIPEFTQVEVQTAIDNLKKGKANDNNGICAEDIKIRGLHTRNMKKNSFQSDPQKR